MKKSGYSVTWVRSISAYWDRKLARQFHDGPFYIGLSDTAVENTWRWLDGSVLEYEPWAESEPNDWGGGEDCVHSNWRGDGEWNDIVCSSRQPYLCEFLPDNHPVCENDGDCEQGPGVCLDGSCQPQ